MSLSNICHACGHKSVVKIYREFKTKRLNNTYYYCATCYMKVINSFTNRPKNEWRKKELCLKPITPR